MFFGGGRFGAGRWRGVQTGWKSDQNLTKMGPNMGHFWSKSGLRRGDRSGGAFLAVRGAIWGPFWVLFVSFSGSVFGVLFGGRLGGLLVASASGSFGSGEDQGRMGEGWGEDGGRIRGG